jgi:hypothetical protein
MTSRNAEAAASRAFGFRGPDSRSRPIGGAKNPPSESRHKLRSALICICVLHITPPRPGPLIRITFFGSFALRIVIKMCEDDRRREHRAATDSRIECYGILLPMLLPI